MDTVFCSAQKLEEYGWLNFGSHCEHNDLVKPGDSLNTTWDGNYYDVPRACLIRFIRTGMWQYYDAAVPAAVHLADIDIAHYDPVDPKLSGIERKCPTAGHFRSFDGGRHFQASGNVDSCKSQSLFELYHLTGDAWYREAGLLSGDYLTVHGGSALRAQGNRITGLFMSWRDSRDAKYKAVWEQQAKATSKGGIATGGTKGWDQVWMYGLADEGLLNYFRQTADLDAVKAIQLSTDGLIVMDVEKRLGGGKRKEYDHLAGFTVPIFGYCYELTGDGKYLAYGLERLAVTADQLQGRSKAFAQHSRISPQFLYYLSKDYQPAKPVIGDKPAADPIEPIIKEFVSRPPTTQKN